MLEDLAAQFKLKTAAVVSRIEDLEKQASAFQQLASEMHEQQSWKEHSAF